MQREIQRTDRWIRLHGMDENKDDIQDVDCLHDSRFAIDMQPQCVSVEKCRAVDETPVPLNLVSVPPQSLIWRTYGETILNIPGNSQSSEVPQKRAFFTSKKDGHRRD